MIPRRRRARPRSAAGRIAPALLLLLGGTAVSADEAACSRPPAEGRQLAHQRANLLAVAASIEASRGRLDRALRYAAEGTRLDLEAREPASIAALQLARAVLTCSEQRVLSGHGDRVNAARFDADGSRVVTASDDGTARAWDVRTACEVARLRQAEKVEEAAFSPDGTRVVTASEEKALTVWDVATGGQVFTVAAGMSTGALSYSPDGTRIVANIAFERRTYAAADGRLLSAVHDDSGGPAWTIRSPDRRYTVDINVDSSDVVLSHAKGRDRKTLKGHRGGLLSALFSPDGRRFLSLSEDGSPRVWDSDTGGLAAVFPANAGKAAFSRDGRQVVTAGSDGTARVWSIIPTHLLAEVRAHAAPAPGSAAPPEQVLSAGFSPDAGTFIAVDRDGAARLWRADGRAVAVLREAAPIRFAAFGADGMRVATVTATGTVQAWDAATGSRLGQPASSAAAPSATSAGMRASSSRPCGTARSASTMPRPAPPWPRAARS